MPAEEVVTGQILQPDTLLDVPTRHLVVPSSPPEATAAETALLSVAPPPPAPPPVASLPVAPPPASMPVVAPSSPPRPSLAPPPSWPDEEGTAALLLPEAKPAALSAQVRVLSLPPGQPASAIRPQWLPNLLMGLVGGAIMLIVLFLGMRLWQPEPKGLVIPTAQQMVLHQQLIDGALRAVRSGQLDQALLLLERIQHDQADPAVDLMIGSLRRQLADTGSGRQ